MPATQEVKGERRSSRVKGICKEKGKGILKTVMPLHESYTVPFRSQNSWHGNVGLKRRTMNRLGEQQNPACATSEIESLRKRGCTAFSSYNGILSLWRES